MTTRIKLIILVLMTSFAGISSLFINRLMLRPVARIERENTVLNNLQRVIIDYVGQVYRLNSESFLPQAKLVLEGRKKLESSFEDVKKLEFLPSVNASIKASIDTILLFGSSLGFAQDTLEQRIEKVITMADDVLNGKRDFTVMELSWNVDKSDTRRFSEVQTSVFALVTKISALNRNTSTTLDNIRKQSEIINGEIAIYKQRAGLFIFLAIFLIVGIPLGFALVFANRLAGRIQRIDIGISRMKDGDLADRINVRSRDEMGRLSENVNSFTDKLSRSILQIKEASRNNINIKEALLESVGKVAETTDQVNESANSILSGMDKLKETVEITDAAGETVEEQLNRLETVLNEQVAMVEESSASITEMITSVGNVSEIIRRKKEAFRHLVDFSGRGGNKLKETNEIISLIHDSVEQIRGTTKIISGIAGQTNLLAMNAAIEAAHAGDAGRGFAVVAQEIRSLAEATSKNSNQINGIMKAIITNIESAVESGKNTGEAFGKIDSEVVGTSQAFDEIVQSMEELRIGGQQILDAMVRLNDFSGQVKDGDVSIRAAASDNRKAIENLEAVSQITNQQIAEITKAINSLAAEMDNVTSITKKADDISRSLQKEVSRYRVTDFEKGNSGEID